jgi:hypothetical protein
MIYQAPGFSGGFLRRVVYLSLFVILFLTISPNNVESRLITGTVTVVTNKVSRLAKFSFRPEGTSVVQGKITYRSQEPRGALYLFMDTEWGK